VKHKPQFGLLIDPIRSIATNPPFIRWLRLFEHEDEHEHEDDLFRPDQPHDPIGEIHCSGQQLFAERDEGDVTTSENEHEAQNEEIHEIDHHHGKEGSMLDQIALSVPKHP
jgi:hypothetical protein